MCSTIRPLPLRHCFGWFQRNHVWKAPTSTFHQNLHLPGLLQPVSRSKGPKCARLSAPSLCATVLVGLKETMYGKPQPVPFTRTLNCQDCSNQFRDPRVQSVLDYPPPPSAPLFWLVSKKPCMESPNQYLSPEPSFARIAPTSFEIQGSKVCSTIRPLPLRHCFGWFQRNHVWKAPTSTFHQNLHLPGLLQPVSRSKGPKCARLSAPSLCATVLVGFKETMYGKPQPVPFTRTFICQDCSNQFRDPRVQSVLDYPPPHSAPLFWLVSKKPCMESPNQYLSPEPSFAKIAPTSFEIQRSKVCSTIRPLPLRHCFGWFQRNHVWKAPTNTFHQNLHLPGLLQPVSRSKGPKCARLSAPSLCATVLVGLKGNHVWKAPTSTFHQNLHLPGLLQPVSRSKGPKCARLSAPSLCATVLGGLKETMYGKPQPVPFTRTLNGQDCSNRFRDPRVQSVLDYPPPPSAPLFWLVSKKPCMESPNQYLSPEPSFARIAPTSFEIQGSKVCSTIRPLTLRHRFGWSQRNHVWKAPTSTFHQNLEWPELLQPVSRSKGPKCARLSAPSLCATVLVGFKETMYGKPQPVPFTRTFICQDCSNQFRDRRVQSVLDYPPPHFAPLFWLVSKKPCMESPNQYLSPEPSFAKIAPTSFEIQRSKVCSTIRPLPLRHCFGWFQRNHVWKAPTSTFHQNLHLPGLLQPVSRSKGPKCARLSAPSLRATVLVGFKETMYGKPQPVPFTRTFICQDCSN